MTLIKNHNDFEPIAQECCLCGGTTTIFVSGSAFVVANGKEYRLYYHKVCLTTNEAKKIVEEKLQKLVQSQIR